MALAWPQYDFTRINDLAPHMGAAAVYESFQVRQDVAWTAQHIPELLKSPGGRFWTFLEGER